MTMIDWRKDAVNSMMFLNDLEMKKSGYQVDIEGEKEALKMFVARLVRMMTQKTAGQRGKAGDLDTIGGLGITEANIIICAMRLCLGGAFGPMPDKIESDF